MEPYDIKQACIDLSNAAIALFDLVDTEGIESPLDDIDGVMKLKAIVESAEEIRDYYFRRNLQRMIAIGVSPATLMKWDTK